MNGLVAFNIFAATMNLMSVLFVPYSKITLINFACIFISSYMAYLAYGAK